ncbi:LytR family transcriptional regulator [Nocardioides sp. GY 10113]|uniref:LytR C-terminal domain-containing protein n=1 Tax=Nocardioides sp. GY 10113 TaxID=2569761 RepID=UPI0010A750AA|nr:LytR C-terminal domain-containing protein [Nocardioides sp. GY 10113]TIC84999.1 LytR family transcriptional regulator [Nocardioides sp. GY 10113]
MNVAARTRSAATAAVLVTLFLGGTAWAWSAVTEPFPKAEETPVCIDRPVAAGDRVRPPDVVVSVLNASTRNGLAGQTLNQLGGFGFARGESGNATVASAKTLTAQIWTTTPDNPDVRLVASHLGKRVRIVEQASDLPGVTVVVGEKFDGVTRGRKQVRATVATSVCGPTPNP